MEPIDFICFKCKHFRKFEDGCDAFPEGIPDEINMENDHSTSLADQGNNKIFEPIDE